MKIQKISTVIAGAVIAAFFVLTSCNDDSDTIGLQFVDESSFELASWDTVTVKMSTVLLDSFQTSDIGTILLGSYADSDLGLISSSAYFRIDGNISESDDDASLLNYNRVVLRLSYDTYSYEDTTQVQTYYVHELADEMDSENGLFYNTTVLDTKFENGIDSPIGQGSVTPEPKGEDYFDILLDDRLGQQIYDLTFNRPSSDDETYILSDLTDGFRVQPDENNTAVIGIQPTIQLIVFYIDFSEVPSEEKKISFTVDTGSQSYFSNIQADDQNAVIQSIQSAENVLPSGASSNQGYIMGGLGLALRVEMPYLRRILEDNPNIALNSVSLSLKPVVRKFDGFRPLPQGLTGSIVDRKNNVIGSLSSGAVLSEDDEFDENTEYIFNVKEFVESQLATLEENENAILITPTNAFTNSVDYLIIGDSDHDEYESNLMLNLIQLKND